MYMPRGACMRYDPNLMGLHFTGDLITSISYLAIGISAMVFLSRMKKFKYTSLYLVYGMFIFLCGITHIFDIIALWNAYYWIDALFKNLTGVFSALAVLYLPQLASIIKDLSDHAKLVEVCDEMRKELHDTKHKMQKLVLQMEEMNHKEQNNSNESTA